MTGRRSSRFKDRGTAFFLFSHEVSFLECIGLQRMAVSQFNIRRKKRRSVTLPIEDAAFELLEICCRCTFSNMSCMFLKYWISGANLMSCHASLWDDINMPYEMHLAEDDMLPKLKPRSIAVSM